MSGNQPVDYSPDKKLVRVSILQQTYTLRSSGEPGETEALAQYVDELMSQIAARSGGADTGRVAVLAALHLADRLRSLEKQLDGRDSDLESLERRLASLIED
ncbi:MAG: cell division protein ZapA [Bryobacteraceae bacterium]|nr:cell division protein ZapA [Bryobacteraceae bacterium]